MHNYYTCTTTESRFNKPLQASGTLRCQFYVLYAYHKNSLESEVDRDSRSQVCRSLMVEGGVLMEKGVSPAL